MKIGLIVDHFKLRNDIRGMVKYLHQNHNLVVFANPNDADLIPETYEVRLMKPLPSGLNNRFRKLVYNYFGNLPSTKKNYKDYIVRRLYKSNPGTISIVKNKIQLWLKLNLPTLVKFDQYIGGLSFEDEHLDDIDIIFSFTDINNENMIANVIDKEISLFTYVHSWDHLAKFHRFSQNKIQYVTWNEDLKSDLMNLHGVVDENIRSLGASQFTFVHDYLEKREPSKSTNRYFYFAASFGYPILAEQEIKLIAHLAKKMEEHLPEINLVFRPYPILNEWGFYDILKEFSNIVFDKFEKKEKVVLSDSDMEHKFSMIENAEAVIHCGTTIGLEASYFKTPVIYLTPEDFDFGVSANNLNYIQFSWDQFHLRKYYRLPEFDNVILYKKDIIPILTRCLEQQSEMLSYNEELMKMSPLYSMEEFVKRLDPIFKGKISD